VPLSLYSAPRCPARVLGALRPSSSTDTAAVRASWLTDDAGALFLAQELALRHTPCRLLEGPPLREMLTVSMWPSPLGPSMVSVLSVRH